MHSIFRLPWCSEPVPPKMAEPDALERMRPEPVVEIPVLAKFKRKRASEGMSPRARPSKKQRPVNSRPSEDKSEPAAPASPLSLDFNASVSPDADMLDVEHLSLDNMLSRAQEVIENEFNVQILMKHNELRLIDQELAKCHIALEQLRRVELRPCADSTALPEGISPTSFDPPYPAAYGVTDGPYTSHYNQWLLHDPLFESGLPPPVYLDDSAGRSTRNSGSARKSMSTSFVFPAPQSETLQSIPNYPAPTIKDKSNPLVLKRSTDNQFVKLICNNCLRGNFSSIQGFLNHCRIAHKVDYKSHDAAAIDCGRILDESEVATLPSDPQPTPSHKPSLSRLSTSYPAPPRGGLVHPFNGPAAPPPSASSRQKATATRAPVPDLAIGNHAPTQPLTASAQAPRLSAYFAKHGFGGDLASAVAGASDKLDLGLDDDSPDAPGQQSPLESMDERASMMTMARSASNKGIRHTQRQPRPAPLTSMGFDGSEALESPQYPPSSAANYSPHTADSNPGLVSDREDDDDDHASVSEDDEDAEYSQRAFPVAGGTCSDNVNVEIDVAGDDEHGVDGAGRVIIRREEAKNTPRKLGKAKR
ncbi:hypothetical protein BDY17DRAFT_35021 [Neohortaea acidophila]|uniref:AHC1-like C2H2 zinc-finger domain-containing protein n=1 Tax=Neohortaea acidophila TaxID=245834 RepID=A0A6A6PLX2_9PEZI|nr:uncharacterized protein BDY17DRAFT_35021 [Neohortaea acidophila]KAF2480257.1 hypothetical protein BDY17DRAFT_35021 [Neohortaea acidophila]